MVILGMEDTDWNKLLFVGFSSSTVLFIISELLGMSSCKYNGVVQFVLHGCICSSDQNLDFAFNRESEGRA